MSAQNKRSRIDQWMLEKIYRAAGQPSVRLELRNSAEVSPAGALPVANIVIEDRKTLLRLLIELEAEFGDAYSEGRITVEGDLVSALEILYRSISQSRTSRMVRQTRLEVHGICSAKLLARLAP